MTKLDSSNEFSPEESEAWFRAKSEEIVRDVAANRAVYAAQLAEAARYHALLRS